jgi:CheY-like chemotaxis protein
MAKAERVLLVIDDDAFEAVFIEDANAAVCAFDTVRHMTNGREAVDVIASDPPAAVLLDLRMPGFSGFDVLDLLKTRGLLAGLLVMMLSNSANQADQAEALERGAASYSVKPAGAEGYALIIQKVRDLVETRRSA